MANAIINHWIKQRQKVQIQGDPKQELPQERCRRHDKNDLSLTSLVLPRFLTGIIVCHRKAS